MAITLPENPAPRSAVPQVVRFGGELMPFLGGEVQNLPRLGTRLALKVTMPPIRGAIARQFQVRLARGQDDRVVMEWPLLDLDPGNPPNPQVAAGGSGSAISIKGLGAGYQLAEGQPLSIIHAERRYMHLSTGLVTANGVGVAAVGIWPPARVIYSAGDVVEIAVPKIEGAVSPGEGVAWDYALEHTMGFDFLVVETK